MTRERWSELCDGIVLKWAEMAEANWYIDWQPENIGDLISDLRCQAQAFEDLTNVYNQENKGVNNGNARICEGK